MYGRNPAHYAEYWKNVQELWLRLYTSNMILVSAINVSAPPHTHTPTVLGGPDRHGREKATAWGPGPG